MWLDRLRRKGRGIATVSAVFMLLLMFAALNGLIVAYFSYNVSVQEQMKIEEDRSHEKIVISGLNLDNSLKIANITVRNLGAIEVRIRALYREEVGATTFLTDPSTYMDTHVAVGKSTTINTISLDLTPEPNAILIAATERGTKSIGVNEIALTFGDLPTNLNTSQLTIGPLLLTFTSLQWTANFDKDGNPIWPPSANGWTIPANTGYCAWRLNVTDVDPDKRSLSITQYSGFTISKAGGTQATTWYLNIPQQTLNWNVTTSITFLGSKSGGTLNQQKGVNNVFLTFFGKYSNGYTFAQTIPFEAITVT